MPESLGKDLHNLDILGITAHWLRTVQAMDRTAWEASVRDAVAGDDRAGLAALFAEAVATWGREATSAAWWTILSATDAGAVTG